MKKKGIVRLIIKVIVLIGSFITGSEVGPILSNL